MTTTETIGCPFCSNANKVTSPDPEYTKYLILTNMVLNQRNIRAVNVMKKMQFTGQKINNLLLFLL